MHVKNSPLEKEGLGGDLLPLFYDKKKFRKDLTFIYIYISYSCNSEFGVAGTRLPGNFFLKIMKKKKETHTLSEVLKKWDTIIPNWRDPNGNVNVKVQTSGKVLDGRYNNRLELRKHVVSNVRSGNHVVIYQGKNTLTITKD